MYRKAIRSSSSDEPQKPRVCDALIEDNGEVSLEVKTSKKRVIIQLCDLLRQIEKAKEDAAQKQDEQK